MHLRLLSFLAFPFLYNSAAAQPRAVLQWEETSFDFGKLPDHYDITHRFYFTNIGKASLLITGVRTTDGCGVADYPKEPILPGKKGSIRYHRMDDTHGEFSKTIFVRTNAANQPPDSDFLLHAEGYTDDWYAPRHDSTHATNSDVH